MNGTLGEWGGEDYTQSKTNEQHLLVHGDSLGVDGGIVKLDQYQYLGNCPPTLPLT